MPGGGLTVPVASASARLGIRPAFDGEVEEGGNAAFDVLATADGSTEPVTCSLYRVQTSFQWYQIDGTWQFEPVRSLGRPWTRPSAGPSRGFASTIRRRRGHR